METDELDETLGEIFRSRNPEEQFETLLIDAGKGRTQVLTKAISIVGTSDGMQCSQGANNDDLSKAAEQIVRTILRLAVHSTRISADEISDLTCCLTIGAEHFSSKGLASVIAYCIEYLKSHENEAVPSQWVEIFSRLVAILSNRRDIPYDDDILDGKEFRTTVIRQLCRLEWTSHNAAYIISAIREFPGLEADDVENVIMKAADSFRLMDPLAVPPVAYHLLLLGGEQLPGKLLECFNEYFQGLTFKESESTATQTTLGSIQKKKALGTVVYHVVHAARHETSIAKNIIKRIRSSSVDENLIMTPFMLSTALGLTGIMHFKMQVVEGLRASIIDSFADISHAQTFAWYNNVRGKVETSFADCFKAVIDSKSSELDFMLDGLKDLGLALLSVDDPQSLTSSYADKCRELGSYIITAIVKKHSSYLRAVMDDLLSQGKSVMHMNCLATCLRAMVRDIIQTKLSEKIMDLVQHLPLMTVEAASPIVKALMPSFQLSRSLLNNLLVVIRKTVYKSTEARKVTAHIMILLLSNSRIVGAIPRSQYSESQSGFSQATQTQVDILGSARENESLCVEILWILKRFFTQPSEVRQLLYLGLHVVSRKNPELIKVICTHLLAQLRTHMNEDHTELRFSGLLDCSNSHIIRSEQLGYLLQCASFVTLRGRRIYRKDSDDEPESLVQCEETLSLWIELISKIEIEELDVVASNILNKNVGGGTPRPLETAHEARNALLYQLLEALEALIEYLALQGSSQGKERIEQLYTKYVAFQTCLKPVKVLKVKGKKDKEKSSKPRGNKKKDQGKATNDGSQTSIKDAPNPKKPVVEPLSKQSITHIITLESIFQILKWLNSASEPAQLGFSSKQVEFERFILSILKNKIDRINNCENIGERERKPQEIITNLASIAGTLWEVCRKPDSTAADTILEAENNSCEDVQIVGSASGTVSLTCMRFEILLDMVEYLVAQKIVAHAEVLRIFNFEVFDDKSLDTMFDDFFESWTTVVEYRSECGGNEDTLATLFSILYAFIQCLAPGSSEPISKALKWCMEYAQISKENLHPTVELGGLVVKSILGIGAKLGKEAEVSFLKLANLAHDALGDVEDDIASTEKHRPIDEPFWLINAETAPAIVCTIGLHVETSLGLVDSMIKRLKIQSSYYKTDKVDELRDKLCLVLMDAVNLTSELIQTSVPAGPCADILMRVIGSVFISTTHLTEHLLDHHNKMKVIFTARKFSNLVKLIGKDFKVRVESLITHVEGIQRDKVDEMMKAKKDGKVPAAMKQKFMKDTKTIPELIYQIEKYEQQLYALSQKAKVNLLAGTKLSTARDFRIEITQLRQALAGKENRDKTSSSKKRPLPEDEDANDAPGDGSETTVSTLSQSGLSHDASRSGLSRGNTTLKRKRT